MNKSILKGQAAGERQTFLLGDDTTLDLIWCPSGEFTMGLAQQRENTPQARWQPHPVRLTQGFWVGKTPITRQQWRAITGEDEYWFNRWSDDNELPATILSWFKARRYCFLLMERLRKSGQLGSFQYVSLPTEAQWEYACRAGTQTPRYFDEDEMSLKEYAWFKENSGNRLHAVAQKLPNSWGIYDLYGNVREWCLDNDSPYTTQLEIDPLHSHDSDFTKVTRGGYYSSYGYECRSGWRDSLDRENDFSEIVGLRVVINAYPFSGKIVTEG